MTHQDDRSFADKIVLVTGAGSGIGRATALVFAYLGAKVVLTDINEQRLSQVADELLDKGCSASAYPVDVASLSQMKDMAGRVLAGNDHLDVLINNAGMALGGELAETTLEQFHALMNVNFWGVVHGVHLFLPSMLERRAGHIVNISSINAFVPIPFNGPYNASKSAILGYTRTLRMELAPYGIGVTAICPGLINTNIARDRAGGDSENPDVQRVINGFEHAMAKRGADPDRVARRIPWAIRKNKAVVKVPFDATLYYWFHTLFPSFFERLCKRIAKGKSVPLL